MLCRDWTTLNQSKAVNIAIVFIGAMCLLYTLHNNKKEVLMKEVKNLHLLSLRAMYHDISSDCFYI